MNKDYYKLIEQVRDDQTVHSLELVEDDNEPTPEEVDSTIEAFLLELEMDEGVDAMIPIVSMARRMFDKAFREELHVTADTVISLHECDGMTPEFLFNQPSHGEYLEELTEEVA